ncbi:NAD-dependent succinate-semialdehyde dehydrogenase [Tessaracoccus sp. OS52]|uniref:NAD-dependent succinate-semialdehyde dehydrogenase n=1 Tax=Tessaracoccus sp. OS52 TaxID=2886691 RepID=UPI001D12A17D|nr:NAD-dependent succinate-semialdehyde dehydrogenase [Tessaracoccus sp. OS52]MCC2594413.1 NAD-dependent succinate-semialdehyde dehydrogenase [Tessaracoccus sp. OS52]
MSRRSLPEDLSTQLFIGGEWVDGARDAIPVVNPATGQELTRVANADVAQGLAALTAADDARAAWAATPPRTRSDLLRAAFDAVVARREDFARTMTLEMGKPLAEADGEVTYGAEFLRWFSEEAVRIHGRYGTLPEGALRALVMKRPVGPSLLLTPWNFPLAMATRKVAPALAAGCTVVLRPSSATPLTTLLLTKVLADVGVPDAVVNVIVSSEHDVTDAIIADPRLRKLSFTGSTPVGQTLLKQASDGVLRTSMELGGNAPFLVFEDADLDAAVAGARAAKLRNIGEACTAANRFLVHESVAEEFARRLSEVFAGLEVGDGLAEGTDVGPLISAEARDGVHALVTGAVEAGAELLTGGEIPEGPGYCYPPTVLTGVAADAEVMMNEIFGPVAPITTFRDEDEALRIANSTRMGLSSYVFTRDVDRIQRMGALLEVGMIGVNTGVLSNAAAPFGGVKQSGLGREGSFEGIEEYLETVYLALPDPS